ncbi:SGNH hydrolase domain-containing protein [Microbacterium galbinum]|uniref:SGNH domain-containing protein n=1 Tax=Microbacterium galbinum TaxID=2851646 RepID=A0ABY4IPZ7_9MICO|nr:SGNH hydrolase domain-containing protein [Microbacterium galbinum]UPL13348.1 hypothetical protein KV396_02170 [Microbacterium galbinum]
MTAQSTAIRRRTTAIVAVLILALVAILESNVAHAATPVSLTLSTSAESVTFSRPLTVTGVARTGSAPLVNAEVKIVGQNVNGVWRILSTTRTDPSGAYTATFAPVEQYRVKAEIAATSTTASAASTSRTITVQPGVYNAVPAQNSYAVVNLSKHVTGNLHGGLAGKRVKLEHLVGGAWTTVAQSYAASDGSFSMSFTPTRTGSTRLRIYIPAGQGLLGKAGPNTVLTTLGSTAELAGRGPTCYGVMSTLTPNCVNPELGGVILPTTVAEELRLVTGGSYGPDCWQSNPTDNVRMCSYGSTRSDATRIAFVGDSHAAGYMAGLRPRLTAENWRVDTYFGVSCRWLDFPDGHGCKPRAVAIESALLHGGYDAIVATGLREPSADPTSAEAVSQQYVRAWSRAAAAGIPVIAIGDFPYLPQAAVDCVTRSRGMAAAGCTAARSEVLAGIDPMYSAARQTPGASFIDLNRYYCGPDTCPLVTGGIVVFRDRHHITGTFSETMGAHVAYRIKKQLQELGIR